MNAITIAYLIIGAILATGAVLETEWQRPMKASDVFFTLMTVWAFLFAWPIVAIFPPERDQ